MSVDERKFLLEEWVKVCGDRIHVIANVGCESLVDTQDLAVHAELAGAKAIGVMPSVFFKPASIEVVIKAG